MEPCPHWTLLWRNPNAHCQATATHIYLKKASLILFKEKASSCKDREEIPLFFGYTTGSFCVPIQCLIIVQEKQKENIAFGEKCGE